MFSFSNYFRFHSKEIESPSTDHLDLLQHWLDNQLNQLRCQTRQCSSIMKRKSNRSSKIENYSTDDELNQVHDNRYPISNTKSLKRPSNHIRHRLLRKNSYLIRHESLKHKNQPLLFEKHYLRNLLKRTDSSSMPHSDLSDISSSRPDNLSESVLSNLESEYDNMCTKDSNTTTILKNSQIITDDDSDDPTTFATIIDRRHYS